jgi:hypothetical protein
MNHKLDTDSQVFFYEQEFYVLSNFSAFSVKIWGHRFPTSEHAYHWAKFLSPEAKEINWKILTAISAHEAFKIVQENKRFVRKDWDYVKEEIMEEILREKVKQHPYVLKKLIETGDRELIEDSWRDDFWGWGENHNGKNVLGKIWMKIRKDYV